MIDSFRIEKGTSSFGTMNDIAFFEQEFSEICSILTGNAGN
jgi:hypothetical protein